MSAAQTSRYQITRGHRTFVVFDAQRAATAGFIIDTFHSQCAAEYAARLLNTGVASVNPHAIVGCKVVAA